MPSVGAVTSNLNVVAKTTNYLAVANNFVLMDATGGPRIVTLPTAPATNMLVAVKKSDSGTNAVTVVPGAGATINGDTACILAIQGASATFQYDGTNWQLLSTGDINTQNPAAGIPSGGTSGQVLAKSSATNYDATWSTPAGGLPTGGTSGQILSKNTATNYDASWATAASGGGLLWPWTAGRVHTEPYSWASGTANVAATPFLTFWPIRIPNACTISQMGIWCAAAGQTFYAGLYADAGPSVTSEGPGARLTGAAGTTIANGVAWASTPYTFTGATNCWIGFSYSNSANIWVHQGQFTNMIPVSLANVSSYVQTGFCLRFTSTSSNGAVPATTNFSSVALSWSNGHTSNYPVIFFNVTA